MMRQAMSASRWSRLARGLRGRVICTASRQENRID